MEDFFWESDVVLSDGYNLTRIFDESVQYDIYQGQTFPLHDYLNNLVVLSVISPKHSGIDIEKYRPHFLRFLVQLHQKTLNLYSQHQQKKMFSCRHVSAKSLNGSAPEKRTQKFLLYCLLLSAPLNSIWATS